MGTKSIGENGSRLVGAIEVMIRLSRSRAEVAYWTEKNKVSGRLKRYDLFFRIPMYIGPNFINKYANFLRCYRALSHPVEPYFNTNESLPEIEITIDCARKDLPLVSKVIECALKNVSNPVSSIHLIVPRVDMDLAGIEVKKLPMRHKVLLKCEDDVLEPSLTQEIRRIFPTRYGWVIHQFLTLQQVLNCQSAGILSIDSDTFILRPMAFLSQDKVQVLMESLEFNPPYYEFLHKVDAKYPLNTASHVTHYSFFQPEIFRELLNLLNVQDLTHIFNLIKEYADLEIDSPFCVDRELYAIGMKIFFPNRYTLVKFANKSVLRKEVETLYQLEQFAKDYNSVSAHSYLQE